MDDLQSAPPPGLRRYVAWLPGLIVFGVLYSVGVMSDEPLLLRLGLLALTAGLSQLFFLLCYVVVVTLSASMLGKATPSIQFHDPLVLGVCLLVATQWGYNIFQRNAQEKRLARCITNIEKVDALIRPVDALSRCREEEERRSDHDGGVP